MNITNEQKKEILAELLSGEITDNGIELTKRLMDNYWEHYNSHNYAKDMKESTIELSSIKSNYALGIFNNSFTSSIPQLEGEFRRRAERKSAMAVIEELKRAFDPDSHWARDFSQRLRHRIPTSTLREVNYEDREKFFDYLKDNSIEELESFEQLPEGFEAVKLFFDGRLRFNDIEFAVNKDVYAWLVNLTEDEIISNRINDAVRVGRKRYGEGARLTRVLTAITTNFGRNDERLIGDYVLQKHEDRLFITSNPLAGLVAGHISESCLSPHGSNSYTMLDAISYKEVFFVLNEKLTWRAMVGIDSEHMEATIFDGYPKRILENIYTIQEFLESKGYTIVKAQKFQRPEDDYTNYWSYDGLFAYNDKVKKGVEITMTEVAVNNVIVGGDSLQYARGFMLDPDGDGDGGLSPYEEDFGAWRSDYCDHCEEYCGDEVYWSDRFEMNTCNWGYKKMVEAELPSLATSGLADIVNILADNLEVVDDITLDHSKKLLEAVYNTIVEGHNADFAMSVMIGNRSSTYTPNIEYMQILLKNVGLNDEEGFAKEVLELYDQAYIWSGGGQKWNPEYGYYIPEKELTEEVLQFYKYAQELEEELEVYMNIAHERVNFEEVARETSFE